MLKICVEKSSDSPHQSTLHAISGGFYANKTMDVESRLTCYFVAATSNVKLVYSASSLPFGVYLALNEITP